jgi:hypothetical protein
MSNWNLRFFRRPSILPGVTLALALGNLAACAGDQKTSLPPAVTVLAKNGIVLVLKWDDGYLAPRVWEYGYTYQPGDRGTIMHGPGLAEQNPRRQRGPRRCVPLKKRPMTGRLVAIRYNYSGYDW